MCELLGICANRPVSVQMSFTGFRQRGKKNPDGWGIAYYDGPVSVVIREPQPAHQSQLAQFLRDSNHVRSDLVIAHVRRSSVGEPKLKNTHPFERELWGRSFVLAHNGTVSAVKRRFILTHYQPIGDTDSEHAFCWLLERFRETLASFADFSRPEALSFVRERAREIGELGTFNFLMSDSERLFAFRSALSDSRHKLHYLLRHAPFRTVRLKDPSMTVDLSTVKEPTERVVVVATEPLTEGEPWVEMQPGELRVFAHGQEIQGTVSDPDWAVLRTIRQHPTRMSISQVAQATGLSLSDVKAAVGRLVNQNYLRQDSRDRRDGFPHLDDRATYYTAPEKRAEIDRRIAS